MYVCIQYSSVYIQPHNTYTYTYGTCAYVHKYVHTHYVRMHCICICMPHMYVCVCKHILIQFVSPLFITMHKILIPLTSFFLSTSQLITWFTCVYVCLSFKGALIWVYLPCNPFHTIHRYFRTHTRIEGECEGGERGWGMKGGGGGGRLAY